MVDLIKSKKIDLVINTPLGRESFFDNFTAPDAHFFWCCRRATQFDLDLSGFPNVAAHFKRMQERPSVKKLLAFEKEVQEGFAKTE